MQDGVEITHKDQRYFYLVLDRFQLLEKQLYGHTVFQCLSSSTLDDGTIGERIAEGDAHFNHGDATTLHGENHFGSTLEGGTTGTEIKGKEFLSPRLAKSLLILFIVVF